MYVTEKTILRKISIIVIAFAVSFSSMLSVMTTETYAASAKAPAKVGGVAGTGSGQTYASIKWTKIKKNKNTKGYTVYRNGAAVGSVGKGTSFFTDYNLAPGRTYTYQVRAYNTYKEKRWYNKKTGQYQKKKPAKKIRGKSKKFTRYKYGKASAATYVATKARANSASPGSSSGGNTGGGTTTQGTKKTVTDYLGNQYTVWEKNGVYYAAADCNANSQWPASSMAQMDRTKDGSWGSGTSARKQVSGATFALGFNDDSTNGSSGAFSIPVYNIDRSKLQISFGNGVTIDKRRYTYFNESGKTLTSYKPYYYVKDGKRIAETTESGDPVKFKAGALDPQLKRPDLITTVQIIIYKDCWDGPGHALGFYNADIPIIVRYDGKEVGTFTIRSAQSSTVTGALPNMSPKRALALDLAIQGITEATGSPNGTGNLERDLNQLASWFGDNYDHSSYPGTKTTVSGYGKTYKVGCEFCTYLLETWAVYRYDDTGLGFGAWGLGGDSHTAFHLDSDPYNYFDTTYRNQR